MLRMPGATDAVERFLAIEIAGRPEKARARVREGEMGGGRAGHVSLVWWTSSSVFARLFRGNPGFSPQGSPNYSHVCTAHPMPLFRASSHLQAHPHRGFVRSDCRRRQRRWGREGGSWRGCRTRREREARWRAGVGFYSFRCAAVENHGTLSRVSPTAGVTLWALCASSEGVVLVVSGGLSFVEKGKQLVLCLRTLPK